MSISAGLLCSLMQFQRLVQGIQYPLVRAAPSSVGSRPGGTGRPPRRPVTSTASPLKRWSWQTATPSFLPLQRTTITGYPLHGTNSFQGCLVVLHYFTALSCFMYALVPKQIPVLSCHTGQNHMD